jgi:pyruvate,water dikinase
MGSVFENPVCGRLSTGIPQLNALLQGLFPGDNLVWQIEDMQEYAHFAIPFAQQALEAGRNCIYLRFGNHPPVLPCEPGIEIINVDPKPGFGYFTKEIHDIITEKGGQTSYVFDNLSSLVSQWATDELLADFFQVTCPHIFKLEALAYFALSYSQHSYQTIARIKSTTQIMINVYKVDKVIYLHPQKVWERYSAEMFLPHRITEPEWQPVFQSGEAATISSIAFREPLIKESPGKSPWESIYNRLLQYRRTAGEIALSPEIAALKRECIRMVIGEHREFAVIAEKYLNLDDLIAIRRRLIGSGRIGGKSAGMLLARRILLTEQSGVDFARVLEPHDSFFIGSDVFFTFLVNNNLFQLRLDLTRNQRISPEEYETAQQLFLEGQFPVEIMAQFRNMLDYFGQAPIIVRSSSVMEDSLGNAFAGKYRSEFLVNQGNPEERLAAFLQAVRLVYASTLNPDAIAYRYRQGLVESDELMAILVQRVSGMPYKHYFFPTMAGVGFSRNIYPWTSRIDPFKGLLRLVFGLGTRAVNRVGGDYSRMIALSHSELRPEIGSKIIRYSQHNADVLDFETNELTSVGVNEFLCPEYDYPNLDLLVSVMEEGVAYDLATHPVSENQSVVLTFDKLIRRTPFAQIMQTMLGTLDQAYGHAVDTEFTVHFAEDDSIKLNLLQCRGLRLPEQSGQAEIPLDLPPQRVLFRSDQAINGGTVCGIGYILYIDPRIYAGASLESKQQLGRLIGRLNRTQEIITRKIILMGPGRWGSTNIHLGVNIGYADISHAAVLAEVASEETGHVPEVSFGTHFFQDLVESQIIYVAIFPSQVESQFNQEFFCAAPNSLTRVLPDAAGFESLVNLIDVPEVTGGLTACMAANPISRQAVCYLT